MIGTGYFAHMQMQAWQQIEPANIVAVCDHDGEKARAFAERYAIPRAYTSAETLLGTEPLNFVDIVTRPESHLALVDMAAHRGVAVLCQKPLAPTLEEARRIVRVCTAAGVPFMVNENWRWQPWYREIKGLLEQGTIGRVFHAAVRLRTGDGRGDAPYAHQPYFKEMPRLLVFETLVHFLDTLRFLLGEVVRVHALTQRINPAIRGEDLALITLAFAQGTTVLIDANRYSEPDTSGEVLADVTFEGEGGRVRLEPSGSLTVHLSGSAPYKQPYRNPGGYRGGSCRATQAHFVTALLEGRPFETNGCDYLRTLALVEAVYASAATVRVVQPDDSIHVGISWGAKP